MSLGICEVIDQEGCGGAFLFLGFIVWEQGGHRNALRLGYFHDCGEDSALDVGVIVFVSGFLVKGEGE